MSSAFLAAANRTAGRVFRSRLIRYGLLLSAMPVAFASAGTRTLYAFTGGSDGAYPMSRLTPDAAGNLYGTTNAAGTFQGGTIFKLGHNGELTSLHQFTRDSAGGNPVTGVSLIRGKLYGGAFSEGGGATTSVIFSVNTDGSNYTILHQFTATGPGGSQFAGYMQRAPNQGEFGFTNFGGDYGEGALFYISPTAFHVLHRFTRDTGERPSELLEDGNGNLFGSTSAGGAQHSGVIFEYTPTTRTYAVLYSFTNGLDGAEPLLGSIGPDGTLYGVAAVGGQHGHGALFSLAPSAGSWSFSVLAPIEGVGGDSTRVPPALSPDGALAGATVTGLVFEYLNGQYLTRFTPNATGYPQDQFLIPQFAPDTILGTSMGGGITTGAADCVPYGCGFIFQGSYPSVTP